MKKLFCVTGRQTQHKNYARSEKCDMLALFCYYVSYLGTEKSIVEERGLVLLHRKGTILRQGEVTLFGGPMPLILLMSDSRK